VSAKQSLHQAIRETRGRFGTNVCHLSSPSEPVDFVNVTARGFQPTSGLRKDCLGGLIADDKTIVNILIHRVTKITAEQRLNARRQSASSARRTVHPPRKAEGDAGKNDDQRDKRRGEPVGHWGTGEGTVAQTQALVVTDTGANIVPLINAKVTRGTEK
ncbi:MAG: hypothetical protein ABIW79_02080, partial [Gemmatimonas sp.]